MSGLPVVTTEICGLSMKHRDGGGDPYTLKHVMQENIYGLPDDMRGKTVIDVGAHIGAFSCLASSRGARVLAFEPEIENFSLLAQNIAGNWRRFGEGRIQPENAAVSGSAHGAAKLYVHEGNLGCHSLQAGVNGFTEGSQFQTVLVLSITDLFGLPPDQDCDFLKLDCEDAEGEILPVVVDELADRIAAIGVEFHSRPFMELMVPRLKEFYTAEKRSDWEWTFKRK